MQAEQQIAEIQEVVADVMKMAQQKGATQVEASISHVQGIAVSTRLKEVETVEFNNDGGLGITVYCGQRKGSVSTADLSHSALVHAVDKALEIASHTSEDPYSGLADPELMLKAPRDMGLYHPVPLDTDEAIEMAIACETAALDADSRITNSDGASYNASLGARVYGNSHGVNFGYASSRYSLSCVVIAKQQEEMQRDYSYTLGRKQNQLLAPEVIGAQAAENTLARLDSRKIKTCNVPVMFHRELAPSFFGHLVSGISGGSLYRKTSFLLDHLGKQILPDWLSIEERPHILGGLASSAFDNDGVATRDLDIVADGVLQNYLLSNYSAKKLGMQTNGHAGGIHNWKVKHSGKDDKALLQEMGTGLLVTEVMGQGVNIVNGDYSRGAAGFWVEDGEIQYPVHEITIASNLKDMFANIVGISSDVENRSSIETGAILVESMQVAGQ